MRVAATLAGQHTRSTLAAAQGGLVERVLEAEAKWPAHAAPCCAVAEAASRTFGRLPSSSGSTLLACRCIPSGTLGTARFHHSVSGASKSGRPGGGETKDGLGLLRALARNKPQAARSEACGLACLKHARQAEGAHTRDCRTCVQSLNATSEPTPPHPRPACSRRCRCPRPRAACQAA